ncbi:hypothetical protein D3C83_251590 [compost metagenome]
MDDRQIVDIHLGIRTGSWEFVGYLNNAFDEEYYVLRQPTLFRWNGDRQSYGVRVRFLW